MRRKIWNVREITPLAYQLAQKHKLSPQLVHIFLNRNVKEDAFSRFLNPTIDDLHSPNLLPDIEKAANRIKTAAASGEKILICGDYDVDGVTSLAIFYEYIKDYPGIYSFYIPHRAKDGYGLNKEVIEKAKAQGRTLIIAFDCGTNSLEEVTLARQYGIDVVVVDHHLSKKELNCPFAFVNPKREDSQYPFYDLSAGALSFKLLQVLKGDSALEVLDLVALSTVCDVVPIKGENRVLLGEGLKVLRKTKRLAIVALCKVVKLKQENIDTFHIGFIIGPRINAAGRVAHANEALELFLTKDKEKIDELVQRFGEYNRKRKEIETKILKEADQMLGGDAFDGHAVVVSGQNWHPGVLGIVASRLKEKYYRPAFVISFDDNVGKGSARSIHSVHLMQVLDQCSSSLSSYGGHSRAAGIEIAKEEVDNFKDKINALLRENLSPDDLIPVLNIDVQIGFQDINLEFIGELGKLKPFGEENAKPLFVTYAVTKKNHVRKIPGGVSIWLTENSRTFEGVIYNKDLQQIIESADTFDIVYSLEENTYHNTPKLTIRDCRV